MNKPYIRVKGKYADGENKYIIEEKVNGKTKFIETLPRVDTLLSIIRLNKTPSKASQKDGKNSTNEGKECAQYLLSEPQKKDGVEELLKSVGIGNVEKIKELREADEVMINHKNGLIEWRNKKGIKGI